ncbi:hypothetical protein DENIS_0915 [Desulfonema ishimotonii]|uniref:Teneurin-like YD-shell domain-containing protein n=1 Tax=Desulfonema ishimotonii TaxID=45657 RepID=A0A401FSP5_9BACT|nr:RHS repeat-associated core domain-containing protein [Desulfonema ishimotonii]GBC59973.1 hypothetical protein DENIS_0915 [Desulfonema ishimotonii]
MPVAMTKGGQRYYFAYDQVGTLRVVTDASGNAVKRIRYDSFGNILTDSDPLFEVPFGFAGGLHDRDTGLVRFGYRDYDPDAGRWTAKDPILFAGGDTDLYGYCLGDPVNWVDPFGLANDQSGMGPLSGSDSDIVKAREIAADKNAGPAEAKKYLKNTIREEREKLKNLKGKERKKLLKRIDQLKGAMKVIPRYYPPQAYPLFIINPDLMRQILDDHSDSCLNES